MSHDQCNDVAGAYCYMCDVVRSGNASTTSASSTPLITAPMNCPAADMYVNYQGCGGCGGLQVGCVMITKQAEKRVK